jgi:hypothetical protein
MPPHGEPKKRMKLKHKKVKMKNGESLSSDDIV